MCFCACFFLRESLIRETINHRKRQASRNGPNIRSSMGNNHMKTAPETISLYGKTYARNSRVVVASLFTKGGTVNGTFRTTKGGIYLSDLQGKERAFVRKDGCGPLTVTRTDSGKRFYMFALCLPERQWLGEPESYMASVEGARDLARSIFANASSRMAILSGSHTR